MGKEIIDIRDFMNIPALEAYRVLGTNIIFTESLKKANLITVVSYGPGEGKTTSAINLAVTLAKSGQKTLFVDADFRKPLKYKRISHKMPIGLSEMYLDNKNYNEIICETTTPNLFLLSSGSKEVNPIEVFSSHMFNGFLRYAKKEYNYVIFDTSSLGSYIDAAVLSSHVDGTIIVARIYDSRIKRVSTMKKQLEKVKANILGVVLNNVPENEFKEYYLINHNYTYIKRDKLNEQVNEQEVKAN